MRSICGFLIVNLRLYSQDGVFAISNPIHHVVNTSPTAIQTRSTIFRGRKGGHILKPSSPDPVQATDLATIVAILRKRAEQVEVELPKDEAFYIAYNILPSVRAFELTLNRLRAHSAATGTQITLAFTQQVLKERIEAEAREAVDLILQRKRSEQSGAKQPKIKPHDLPAADRDFVFLLLKTGDRRKVTHVRHVLEVNLRERERETLARRDPYERELERRTKKRKQA